MSETPDPHQEEESTRAKQEGGGDLTVDDLNRARNNYRKSEVARLRKMLEQAPKPPDVDLSSGSVRELDPDAVRDDIRRIGELEDTA